jgi:hypothetical protein
MIGPVSRQARTRWETQQKRETSGNFFPKPGSGTPTFKKTPSDSKSGCKNSGGGEKVSSFQTHGEQSALGLSAVARVVQSVRKGE